MRIQDVDGLQFDFDQPTAAGNRRCRNQVFVKNDRAYLVSATSFDQFFEDDFTTAALARFRLDQPARSADTASLTQRERRTHAMFFTGIALHYDEHQNFQQSRRFYRIACDLQPSNPTCVENLANAYIADSRYQEALQVIEAYSESMWDKGQLPVIHAMVQIAAGNKELAFKEFRELFAGGYWNEADFITFIEFIAEHNGAEAALSEMEDFQRGAGQDTLQLADLRGRLLADAERFDEAI